MSETMTDDQIETILNNALTEAHVTHEFRESGPANARERLQASLYVVPELDRMIESIDILRYATDGVTEVVDDTAVIREHPEVPCTTAQRRAALLEQGWTPVGAWTLDGPDAATVSVVRRDRSARDTRTATSP